ncbi:MAG TPA: hypothetical protein VN799_06105 [Acidimicrobiales bacterium]|nr:hypothetical protein [Acidimicrobiales bacterium]
MSGWSDDLVDRLRSIQDEVTGIQSALGGGHLARGTDSANQLVAMATELLEDLDRDRSRDHNHDAELIAALRVYRNAAFAFRKLAGAGGESEEALRLACTAMIEQGHDHSRAYRGRPPL